MKFKEKLKYISNRALVLGTVIFGVFIILAVIQLLLAYKGETPWWMAIIITIFAILFPIVFWLWIHRPYMRCEKMTDRFLDGYIFSEKEDMELLNLTPSIQKQMKMVDRIVRSPQYMDLNKRQAQYLALQNQINAHFIYNVLESIKMMAEIDEEYAISDAVTALGKLLRYSMKWVSGNVLVEQELEYIKNYMALINLRFDYEIYLSLNLPELVLKQEIPKMFLQPIVENAIYHGIEQMAEDTNIYIKGILDGDDCVIEITDAGKGMSEEEVEKLRLKIAGKIDSNGGSGNGIGLKNVQDRIHIAFGDQYGIEIASKLGCYTKIMVRIPITHRQSEENDPEHK